MAAQRDVAAPAADQILDDKRSCHCAEALRSEDSQLVELEYAFGSRGGLSGTLVSSARRAASQ